jgi:type I restriction enzyme, S subunit
MKKWKDAALGDLTDPIATWNPSRSADADRFWYVDLSAIDQDTKAIVDPRELLCSEAPSRARQVVQYDDILVSTVRPNLNGVARLPKELDGATASTGFCVLRARQACLNPGYLFHWVKTPAFVADMVRKATGASYPAVSDRIVRDSFIPLPPLPVQRRIAEVLDRAEALRAKRRAALAQLDALTRAIFLDMFGDPATNPKEWALRRIGDLLQSAAYGTSKKAGPTGEFPVLRMNNITRTGDLALADLKYMDLGRHEQARFLVESGDVLFNRTNSAELVGKTAIFRESQPMAYAGYLIRLRTNGDNDPEYLAAFLNSAYAKRVLRSLCKSIIGMANINATEVQAITIAQPPLGVQQEFARRVVAVEKLKTAHRASLVELDALFASLQHRAFRGEL